MGKRSAEYVTLDNVEARAAQWLSRLRSQVAPRPQLRLVPSRSALLVIDMQRYFAHPSGRCYLPAAGAAVHQTALLIQRWRSLGAPVFFTRHGHTGQGDLGMLGKFFKDYIRCGEPDAELVPELAPRPDERVFPKTTYDAFWQTDLDEELQRRHVEQVLICGVLTHLCCETSARAAFCRGFEVYLAVDALASSSEELHLGALRGLADGVAILMSTREIVGA